jgi:hypothetical protein
MHVDGELSSRHLTGACAGTCCEIQGWQSSSAAEGLLLADCKQANTCNFPAYPFARFSPAFQDMRHTFALHDQQARG